MSESRDINLSSIVIKEKTVKFLHFTVFSFRLTEETLIFSNKTYSYVIITLIYLIITHIAYLLSKSSILIINIININLYFYLIIINLIIYLIIYLLLN